MSLVTNLILVYLMVLKECILADSTVWPYGTYGLPKATSGCPESRGGLWSEGYIYQDLEDDTPRKSAVSASFNMEAKLTKPYQNIERTFCIKKDSGSFKRSWPKGSFCIYKKNQCPFGMFEGSVTWDDEKLNNDNRQSGILPDGTYYYHYGPTTIEYCCQDKGYWFNSIELPVDRPFYLLPHKSPNCQRVKWALSSLEYIVYDTENDNNGDQFSGSHVFTNKVKSSPKIYYCYYEGCRYNLKSDNGSFTSSTTASLIYPDFQHCSWLVTVHETLLISLIFTSIRVPNCQENFIDIYDGRDKTFPLLARYCGSNATVDNKLKSTGNNLYLVFKTGNNSLNDNMHPEFHANYSTHLKPELWPYGTYGLPKAISGCPDSGGGVWGEGYIFQDMDNDTPRKSKLSDNFHMEAKLTKVYKDINRTFCIKKYPGTFNRSWPTGSYCIYKKNQCPFGMLDGSVKWNDQSYDNRNHHSGFLPDGTYYYGWTTIEYCCQEHGYWFNSIELPVDRPFYLLPHKSPHCQRVKWALSSLEYIVYDTENYYNDDQFSGSHVFTNKVNSLPKMYYCYYQGCRRQKLHGESGSFSSLRNVSDIYPDFQYCSWLITVNKPLLVSLSFTSIQVHNCDENYIDIYDGSNETFPLLARYCNLSAAEANKVKSTANNLYVVFKSGNNSLNPGIHLKFYAIYTSAKQTLTTSLPSSLGTSRTTLDPKASTVMFPSTKANTGGQERHSESKSDSVRVISIVLPILAGLAIVVFIVIIIYRKRHKNSGGLEEELRVNPFYDLTSVNKYETPPVLYQPNRMEEVTVVGKKQDNPIYEPGTDGDASSEMYASVDNVEYEPYNDNPAEDKDEPRSFHNQPNDQSCISLENAEQDNPIYEPGTDGDPGTEELYTSIDNVEDEPYNGTAEINDPNSFYSQPGGII